jgi:DMSO reductase anchor subunit
VFFYTIVGTFIYEFNSLLFWRVIITDCGYGMRVFLFGGVMGFLSSLMLNKRNTTINHRRFKSDSYYQSINLIGAIIIWCLISVLSLADLWRGVGSDKQNVPFAMINMTIALCGSVIGATCVSIFLYKKLSAHILVFSTFAVMNL